MNIKIQTNISGKIPKDEIEIIINTSENSEMLNKIIDNIQTMSKNIDTIIGVNNSNISIIQVSKILYFYSKEQNNYCRTKDGEFKIKKKLYELEETLNKNTFIRISNSCIANIEYVKSFDLSKIGNIIVKFTDDTSEYVSKRRIPYVMKFLRERGN